MYAVYVTMGRYKPTIENFFEIFSFLHLSCVNSAWTFDMNDLKWLLCPAESVEMYQAVPQVKNASMQHLSKNIYTQMLLMVHMTLKNSMSTWSYGAL